MTEASSEKTTTPICACGGHESSDHLRNCPMCGDDIGFPNVRAAEKQEEIDALDQRYQDALNRASARNCRKAVGQFEAALAGSKAVYCRPISQVKEIVSSESLLFAPYHKYIRGLARLPENNSWDPGRPGRDATLFPYYYEEIQFAALSLDWSGAAGYGGCEMVLREEMIARRATVFVENSSLFILRERVIAGESIPPGHRSTWSNRDRLAVAKLADKIDSNTPNSEYAQILMEPSVRTDNDIIEVHIYGPIHPRAIERITIKEPKRKADKIIMISILRQFRKLGIQAKVCK